jgi:uncharacterized protein (TIGR03000 family)
MDADSSVVAIYEHIDQAEDAVQHLGKAGFPIDRASIIARNLGTERKVRGFVTSCDVAKSSARTHAWVGGIFGLPRKAMKRRITLGLICALPYLLLSAQSTRAQTIYGPYANPTPQPRPQYFFQRYFQTANTPQFPYTDSIDAMNSYGAYTEGPGFFYSSVVPPASAPEEQVAYVHVRVAPPHAEISIEGSKTRQIGSSRLFVSPPLNQGQNYVYTIQVSWNENGRVVTQQRKVPIRAGDRISMVFREPQPAASTAALQSQPGS